MSEIIIFFFYIFMYTILSCSNTSTEVFFLNSLISPLEHTIGLIDNIELQLPELAFCYLVRKDLAGYRIGDAKAA